MALITSDDDEEEFYCVISDTIVSTLIPRSTIIPLSTDNLIPPLYRLYSVIGRLNSRTFVLDARAQFKAGQDSAIKLMKLVNPGTIIEAFAANQVSRPRAGR